MGQMSNRTPVGRLALRAEGDQWNAYYALGDTLDGALLLASIHLALVQQHPQRKMQFMTLMRGVVADILDEAIGQRPSWKHPKTAPENERSGRA